MNARRRLLTDFRLWMAVAAAALSMATAPTQAERHSARVRGQFVDTAGNPVAEVAVLASYWPGESTPATSDAEGRFDSVFAWDARQATTWFSIGACKFGFTRYEFRPQERVRPDQVLELGKIVLQPGGAIAGRLLDEAQHPLANAQAEAIDAVKNAQSASPASEKGPNWDWIGGGATTDATGSFDVIGLPPGKYALWLKHDSTYWCSTEPFEIKAGERVRAGDFTLHALPPEWRIEGFVLDPSGAPVAGAIVSSSVPDEEHKTGIDVGFSLEFESKTDAAGRFVLYLPQPYAKPLELKAKLESGLYDDASVENIKPGARDVRIQLGAMRDVEVLVTDTADKPIEEFGWTINVETGQWFSSSGEPSKHHAGGRAHVRIPVGKVSIAIDSDRHHNAFDGVEVPSDLHGEPMRFRLQTLDAVRGRVMFEGRPVAGARVELVQRSPNMLGKEQFPDYWDGLYYGLRGDETLSDAQGDFAIPSDFPHLTYYAHAVALGFAEGFSLATKVGGEPVTVELSRGGALDGSVLLPAGHDPRGIEVRAYRKPRISSIDSDLGCVFRTQVDEVGHWKIESLAAGPWLVALDVPPGLATELGWDQKRVERCREVPWFFAVTSGGTTRADLDMRDETLLYLRGKIATLSGKAHHPPYAQLFLEPPLALDIALEGFSDDGSFEFTVRKPGRYRLAIHPSPGGSGGDVITDLVDLAPGDNTWRR